MNELVSLILGGVIGGLISIAVSKYYYIKQVDKRLTIYIHLASPVLRGADPNIRQHLKIHYHNQEVNDLYDLQLIIANEGYKPVRNYIKPLSFKMPNGIRVIDKSIMYTKPKDRDVAVEIVELVEQGEQVEFHFPILNPGDFFLAKILFDGVIDPKDLIFNITDEDLPSSLKPVMWPTVRITPGQEIETKEHKPRGLNYLFSALLFFLFMIFLFPVIILVEIVDLFDPGLMFLWGWITTITLTVLATISFVSSFLLVTSEFDLERRLAQRRYKLPKTITIAQEIENNK